VNKPAGVHVHRSEFAPDEPAVVELLQAQTGLKLFPVHRLDRPTSGVLLFALDHEAASSLGKSFQERRVEKLYEALVRGWCPSGVVTSPVQPDRKIKQWLDAETAFELVHAYEAPWPRRGFDTFRFSLVQARPVTGRRHQIRQHLDDLRHPILGDTVWGDTALNNWLTSAGWRMPGEGVAAVDESEAIGLQLWCRRLEFDHPEGKKKLVLEAPLRREDQLRRERFLPWVIKAPLRS
jgi:tRNA pseudouridine65 synthase